MKKKTNLQKQILMGLVALAAAAAPMLVAVPTEAASNQSLYDEYQAATKIQREQADSIVEHNKAEAAKMAAPETGRTGSRRRK